MSLKCEGWKNVSGSGDQKCKCGSWKQHWLNFSGATEWPSECSIKGCSEKPVDGGHLRCSENNLEYIAPLCSKHNNPNNTEEMTLKGGVKLARANRSETCEKTKK
jgi:hypothetical protein